MFQKGLFIGQEKIPFTSRLYVGNGGTNAVTGVRFSPNFVWIKDRDATSNHHIFDTIRGVHNYLTSDSNSAEGTSATTLTSFDADGFTLGGNTNNNQVSNNYVAWCLLAQATATHSSHDGENYNPYSGFSMLEYTGDGVVGRSVATSLSSLEMIFAKDQSTANSWAVYHKDLTSATYYLVLDTNANETNGGGNVWNVAPSGGTIQVGNSALVNTNNDVYTFYSFTSVAGKTKIGSYTGNGSSTGPTVTTDFLPGLLIIKAVNTTANQSWHMFDSKRDISNPRTEYLPADTNGTEATLTGGVDFNSANFQIKTSSAAVNENGKKYIYLCAKDFVA